MPDMRVSKTQQQNNLDSGHIGVIWLRKSETIYELINVNCRVAFLNTLLGEL